MSARSVLFAALPLTLLLALGCAPSGGGGGGDDDDDDAAPSDALTMQTTMGEIGLRLFLEDAPITTENFLGYVDAGYYDGEDGLGATVFHRVVAGFVVQGGGFTEAGAQKVTDPAIVNEAIDSGLGNDRGTLAMARTGDPDSATSQFYFNLVDNDMLNPGGNSDAGYAVFAEVTRGLDVMDAMGAVATADSVPVEDIVIESLTRD